MPLILNPEINLKTFFYFFSYILFAQENFHFD